MKKILIAILVLSVSLFTYANGTQAAQPPTGIYSAIVSSHHTDHGDPEEEGTIAWHLEQGAGKTIRLKLRKGTYYVSQGIQLKSHTRIKGAGKHTRIVATEELDDHIFYNVNQNYSGARGIHHVTLSSMTLKGKRELRKNCVQIVAKNSRRSSNITMSNLHVRTCGRHGVHIKGANDVVVRESHFYNNGQNIYHDHNLYLLRVTTARIHDIYTTGASSNGISSTRLKDAIISQVISKKNGNRGIRFGGGRDIILKNSTFAGNGLLSEYDADGVVITSDDYDNKSNTITVENIVVKNHPGSGIAVDFANDVSISDVLLQKNNGCQIFSEHADVELRIDSLAPSQQLDRNHDCITDI